MKKAKKFTEKYFRNPFFISTAAISALAAIFVIGGFFITNGDTLAIGGSPQGPNNAGTGVNVFGEGAGILAWSNPNNITSVGSPYVAADIRLLKTRFLEGTNYNFNIPDDATIDGIEVVVNRMGEQNTFLGTTYGVRDYGIYLVKNVDGSPVVQISGNNKATSALWPELLTPTTYGSSGDLWGLILTPTDINNVNFGVALSVENTGLTKKMATVDYIQITVYYTVPQGHIIIDKVTNPSADPQVFDFDASGGEYADFSLADESAPNDQILAPGTYSISETVPDGWDLTSATCDDGSPIDAISLQADETVTCTFVNTKRGSITVKKDVVAPDGITDVEDNYWFTARLNGEDPQNLIEFHDCVYSNLLPDTYMITEDPDSNYTLQSITSDGQITVGAGENIEVIVTNAQKQGNLTVIKHVVNHGIGEAIAADFTMNVTGTSVSNPSFPGDESGTTVTLDPGQYSVDETGPQGYAMTQTGDCSGTITSNGNLTCTITNSDIPESQGAITVIKEVINDDGGTFVKGDFTLKITPIIDQQAESNPTGDESDSINPEDCGGAPTEIIATSGEANFVIPGNYVVSEDDPSPEYTNTSVVCKSGEITQEGSISVAEQQAWVCTITNDDEPGTLIVNKEVINDNGRTKTASDFSFSINGGEPIVFEQDGQNVLTVASSTYTITEPAVSGYTTNYENCTDLVITNGGTVTCTITNDDDAQPKLTVTKVVINDNDGTMTVEDFPLFVDETQVTSGAETGFEAGTYIVSEAQQTGYTGTITGDCDEDGSIILIAGDIKSCTITNDDNVPAPVQPSGGGGGGGGAIIPGVNYGSEAVLDVGTSSVKITWTTNYFATSRVVYDVAPVNFSADNPPNYGYAFSTVEQDTPAVSDGVTYHEVWLTDLTPGSTYYCLCVSHASPDTFGRELSFATLPIPPEELVMAEEIVEETIIPSGEETFIPEEETVTPEEILIPEEEIISGEETTEAPAETLITETPAPVVVQPTGLLAAIGTMPLNLKIILIIAAIIIIGLIALRLINKRKKS